MTPGSAIGSLALVKDARHERREGLLGTVDILRGGPGRAGSGHPSNFNFARSTPGWMTELRDVGQTLKLTDCSPADRAVVLEIIQRAFHFDIQVGGVLVVDAIVRM
jgi:hypothetical protein